MNKMVPPSAVGQSVEEADYEADFRATARSLGDRSALAVSHLWGIVRRRAISIIVTWAATFVFAILLIFALPARYTAESTLLVDPQNDTLVALNQLVGGQQPGNIPDMVQNQIQILTTSSFVGRIVDKLNLTADPEFREATFFGIPGALIRIKNFVMRVPPLDPQAAREKLRDAVIENFLGHLKADVTSGTSVITVDFWSENPRKAEIIANAIADGYITDQLEAKFESTRVANTWLSERLAELRQRVAKAESDAATYAAANNLQPLTQAGETLQNARVASLNDALLKARADLADRQSQYDGVKAVLARGGSVDAIPQIMSSAVFQSLRTQRASLIQQQSQMSGTYGPRHPEMIKLNEEIASVNQQINGEIQRILSAQQSEVSVAAAQVNSIENSLKGAQSQYSQANQAAVHLGELQRSAESAKTLYESFLKRFNEIGEQGSIPATQGRIISRADLPAGPSFPKPLLFIIGGLVAGLGMAAVVAFILEQFDRGLRNREEVEEQLGLPMIGNLPVAELAELKSETGDQIAADLVYLKPLSAYNESFRFLRANIQLSNVDNPPKSLLVTSSMPNEGKSTGALSLARSAAIAGDKVLLVDADLRRPSIGKMLGLTDTDAPGLVQCITQEVQLSEAIRRDPHTPLHVLLAGKMVQSPADFLSAAATRRFFQNLKESYDLIVIDSSPVLPVIDSRILGTIVDSAVFFVRWEETPKDAAQESLRLLRDFNVPVAGVALSMTDRKRQKRYGYYGDSYSYYYGYYRNYYAA